MERLRLARQDEPCAFCDMTPASGAWGHPCDDSPDRLHWSAEQLHDDSRIHAEAIGTSLRRAAYELEQAAERVEALPKRWRRKMPFELSPAYLRIEAERARDTLHVHGLLDV